MHERKTEYVKIERASQLVAKLFDEDSDIMGQINENIKLFGINGFFRKLETFGFTKEIFERLNAVRLILFGIGEAEVIPEELVADMIAQMHKSDIERTKGGDVL